MTETRKPRKKKKEYLYHASDHKKFLEIGSKMGIRKGSEAYRVMTSKDKDLPDNYGFLVKDKKRTDEGRWLLAACELEMSFSEFCMTAYILVKDRMMRRAGYNFGKPMFERSQLRGTFATRIKYRPVMNILTRLKRKGVIENYYASSVTAIVPESDKIFEKYEYELVTLEEYIMIETEGASGFF